MDIKHLVNEYLSRTRMLQLATCLNDQPWNCTVYYAFDDDWNIYWISTPDRRHSKEIVINPKVSGAIAFSQEPYPKDGVQGLQFEGVAEMLSGDEEEKASKFYIDQLDREDTLLEDIRSGKNPHKFYRIKPTKFVLFDSVHFPDNSRREITL
ncbi:MAG: hypothetical protein HKL80_02400 [Acidimicrobiales bacterium]|nr:hypothetical protein [Acidimicrobiales bacterium]